MQYLYRMILSFVAVAAFDSCVVLHHAQVGEIDNRRGLGERFEVLVSETGINIEEAATVARHLTKSDAAKGDIGNAAAILGLFQMGPRTGNIVFSEHYAENVLEMIYAECPSRRVTGLTSIRETNKYPVVSGEVVKITGYCLRN